MQYIDSVFGSKIKYKPLGSDIRLPYYLADNYTLRRLEINHIEFILVQPRNDLPQIASLQVQLNKIKVLMKAPVAIALPELSYRQRENLMKADIPFIVDYKQMYLPFLGVSLSERYKNATEKFNEMLPSAQLLLLYLIYSKAQSLSLGEAADKLQVSLMTISKAHRQLEKIGAIRVEQANKLKKYIVPLYTGQELYNKFSEYMTNPVRKTIYIDKDKINDDCVLAGDTVLAEYSMLNAPRVEIYACWYKRHLCGSDELIDAKRQAKLEYWKYNPLILARGGAADPLSTALSFKDCMDERVEGAVEEMLVAFWEEYNGTGY